MRDRTYLFSKVDWFSVDQHQTRALTTDIEHIQADRLLNTSVEDLCDYFEKKYRIDVPVLQRNDIVADQQETKINVSQHRDRYIRDRSQPFYVPGTTVEITVPYDGDGGVFGIRPTSYTMSPPSAEVRDNGLIFKIVGTDLTADEVRGRIERELVQVEDHSTTLRKDVSGFNSRLRSVAQDGIERRRQKLLTDRNLVADLGFKIKERRGAPRTYAAPEVRRKITPRMPSASIVPFKPEPALGDLDYKHILKVIQDMAHVMELSPMAFRSMDEESLRSHFLVQLNGHYEGQATGETFNYEGKTDILLRVNGKNIFIAECKFWDGPKKLTETVDQLLGYSSWRDTKVAVILFNRNKDFSKVLRAIPEVVTSHPNCKRDLGAPSETHFRFLFAHRDDRNREMTLTVLAFDVPS